MEEGKPGAPVDLPFDAPLEGEGDKPFRAFTVYRDLGPDRSTATVARQLGISKTLVQRWCARWSWVARARAYDTWLDEVRRGAAKRAVEEMAARHAELAAAMIERVLARVESIPIDELRAADIPRWATAAVTIERLARGEPTTIDQYSGPRIVEVLMPEVTGDAGDDEGAPVRAENR